MLANDLELRGVLRVCDMLSACDAASVVAREVLTKFTVLVQVVHDVMMNRGSPVLRAHRHLDVHTLLRCQDWVDKVGSRCIWMARNLHLLRLIERL